MVATRVILEPCFAFIRTTTTPCSSSRKVRTWCGGELNVVVLPLRVEEGVHDKGLDLKRVDVDDDDHLDGEEELIVECGVDEQEHVHFAGLHLQFEPI